MKTISDSTSAPELEVLKKLNEIHKENQLPKKLLEKMDLHRSEIKDIALGFCKDCGLLEFWFICDNDRDGYTVAACCFGKAVEYLDAAQKK